MQKGQKEKPEIPLQQTEAWYKLQQDLDEKAYFLPETDENTKSEENNYQILVQEKNTPFGNYFFLPYGPYISKKDAAKTAYNELLSIAKQKNVIFMRIEPQNAENASYWLEQPKCKKSKDLSPKETWVLDLTKKMDDIYAEMKQNTRNLCKNYQNKGISVKKYVFEKAKKQHFPAETDEKCQKIQILIDLQKKVAKKNHFTPLSEKYLKTEFKQPFSSLFIAYQGETPIAASLFFDGEKTRYYIQSASDQNFRKLPGTQAILIEAIKDAKESGLKKFDFWGIAPENADKNHPWFGFTQFKKSFGGKEITYAGTHDIILKPFKYRLYNLTRKINLFLRKIKK